ncbi:hypothetical protein [Micromonospora sp. WMMD1082]|uniref:hypothetical protein n=1 Tax=Micromonospora sp. WMMD1082 TaxID=3016104 RepID=UPI002415F4C5|nr:hypothetical protein [Micromonospora sp. WMMD1082]MDG4792442.1 hypothetical protein [Micromonospora sp. WMMD1082]
MVMVAAIPAFVLAPVSAPVPAGASLLLSPAEYPALIKGDIPREAEPSPEARILMARQDTLNAWADKVAGFSQQNGGSGLGGIRVSPMTNEIFVYWHGDVPEEISTMASEAADSAKFHLAPASHTRKQLKEAARQISSSARVRASGVSMVKVLPDGSGIEVSTSDLDASRRSTAFLSDVRIVFTHRAAAPEPFIGRWNDTAPFWGGAVIENRDGHLCSSGFGIARSYDTRFQFTLTSNHCKTDPLTSTRFWSWGGAELGVANDYDWDRDTTAIGTGAAGGSQGYIYTGDTGQGETFASVSGWANNYVGNLFVCTSGAFSGERCDIEITNTDVDILTENGTIYEQAEGEQVQLRSAAGQGDSGGPVYTRNANGRVTARGLVSAGDVLNTRTECTGVTGTRICSWRIYFSQMSHVVGHYNAVVLTGG